jgi:hypothetical protein
MRRIVAPVVLATLSAATLVVVLGGTAHAQGACELLTKKEASKILGFKVVKTEELSEPATQTEGCDYRTKKYWAKRFKKLDAPLKLRITVQPFDEETVAIVEQLAADEDAEPVEGLGDRAFYTDSNDLVAVAGNKVFQAEVTNIEWKGNELTTLIKEPERAAMEKLVAGAG